MELRPYQSRTLTDLYQWFRENKSGNPVVCLPGGSGKSVVIGKFVEQVIKKKPSLRILMLVHVKELIEQNADKLLKIWPNAPLGIYSASLGKREIDAITYGGIQSLRNKADYLRQIDIMIVDEAHWISNTEAGGYRKLIAELEVYNPNMRVIGFTASPYRVGQGKLTDGDLFNDIIEPVTITELVNLGHLTPLSSKNTSFKLDAQGVKKTAGDYQSKAMEEKFNTEDNNNGVAFELIEKAAGRKHWLIFCSGVAHARDFSETLNGLGISADYVTGADSVSVRDAKIKAFEAGEIKALCNVGILTTGYDFPALDCIAMLRATTSPGLYLQIAVRGMRLFEGKKDCLVLDFCGNVDRHGPVTHINPPRKKGEKAGDAPVRTCPECDEILHLSVSTCPCCGYQFPAKEKEYALSKQDIMGAEEEMQVTRWFWSKHISKTSGKEMVKLTYYGNLSDTPISEYFAVTHEGYAAKKSMQTLGDICARAEMNINFQDFGGGYGLNIANFVQFANKNGRPPDTVKHVKSGKFYNITGRYWKEKYHKALPEFEKLKEEVSDLLKSGLSWDQVTNLMFHKYKSLHLEKIIESLGKSIYE